MKIAVYAISKNEEQFVERFCKSAIDADLILIADTGSTDRTVEEARKYGATVYEIAVKPWRFDKARDTALNLIPGDYDICISLDLDEVLEQLIQADIPVVTMEMTRSQLLYDTDWIVQRHQEQLALGSATTLTPEQYITVLNYKQQLRDLTNTYSINTPTEQVVWPTNPLN